MSPILSPSDLEQISTATLGHYQDNAHAFKEGTWGHDVSQNQEALLDALNGEGPHHILDFGCGPGRDLVAFQNRGVQVTGLEGCATFCAMAREASGARVLHQNFLALDLESESFDGIFANASLFHVPLQELPRVLEELRTALKPQGILFSSNPRGPDIEEWYGERYGAYHSPENWVKNVREVGFEEVRQYYRPPGLPRQEQPWFASVWRKV